MLIATLPSPHRAALVAQILSHPRIDGARFNTGTRSPFSPKETLERLLTQAQAAGKRLWVDLKGRQLRITQWAVPTYGDIILNHPIRCTLPATLILRGGERTSITHVDGATIYVDPPPRDATGDGQAVNVHAPDLEIDGTLTDEDHEYLAACRELGVTDTMLSFVECADDLAEVRALLPGARLVLKIESPAGLDFIRTAAPETLAGCQLMAARDDLYVNVDDPAEILAAITDIVRIDPEAIVASRLLSGVERRTGLSLGDICDIELMRRLGYRHYLLSDGLCHNVFAAAMEAWERVRPLTEVPDVASD